MTKSALQLAFMLALVTAPTTALAQMLQFRCATDSLDAATALQRIEWARTCALTTNTGGPNSWFLSTALDTNSSPAKDYKEINTSRAFTGSGTSYNVNASYGFCRYESTSVYTVFQETSGPTAGFFKWSHTIQRSRPFYPVFETSPIAGGGIQLLPLPTLPNDCNLYQRGANGSFVPWTGSFFVIGYCSPL